MEVYIGIEIEIFRIYKTKDGLKSQYDKYAGKKVAVFELTDVKDIDEIIED